MSLNNNLRSWREAAKLSREQVAERVGVSNISIFRIEKGEQQPRTALLRKLCTLFGMSESAFYSAEANVTPAAVGSRLIPILDFVQAGAFHPIGQNIDPEFDEYVLTDLDPSDDAFAMRIRGRSMEPEFREGNLVLIDPAVDPVPEDFVVALDEHREGTFKQYRDAGVGKNGEKVFELVSLNPAYPSWRSDRQKISILGTMIEHRRFRRS